MPSATNYEQVPLPFENNLKEIGQKTIEIHHDKLYVGYVNKMKSIAARLGEMAVSGDGLDEANQTYSELRALRRGETFATNGTFLHEAYFDVLGGDGVPKGSLMEAMATKWGSAEKGIAALSATSMAIRGWAVLCWDANLGELKIYGCDAHNQGAVWGCIPLITIDVYEHSYFIDFGSDRKSYLKAFWNNLNWESANKRYDMASKVNLQA